MDRKFDFSWLSEYGDGGDFEVREVGARSCTLYRVGDVRFRLELQFSLRPAVPKLPLPRYQDSDLTFLLNNLVFIEQKVRDLLGAVRSVLASLGSKWWRRRSLQFLSPSQTDKLSPRPLWSGDIVIIDGVTVGASSLLKRNTGTETRTTKDVEDTGKNEKHGEKFHQLLELEEEILAPHTHFCTLCGTQISSVLQYSSL